MQKVDIPDIDEDPLAPLKRFRVPLTALGLTLGLPLFYRQCVAVDCSWAPWWIAFPGFPWFSIGTNLALAFVYFLYFFALLHVGPAMVPDKLKRMGLYLLVSAFLLYLLPLGLLLAGLR